MTFTPGLPADVPMSAAGDSFWFATRILNCVAVLGIAIREVEGRQARRQHVDAGDVVLVVVLVDVRDLRTGVFLGRARLPACSRCRSRSGRPTRPDRRRRRRRERQVGIGVEIGLAHLGEPGHDRRRHHARPHEASDGDPGRTRLRRAAGVEHAIAILELLVVVEVEDRLLDAATGREPPGTPSSRRAAAHRRRPRGSRPSGWSTRRHSGRRRRNPPSPTTRSPAGNASFQPCFWPAPTA